MSKNNAKMVVSRKNGFLWGGIMTALAVCVRVILWFFLIFSGDSDVFVSDFCLITILLLVVSTVLPLSLYMSTYNSYARLAAKYPSNRKSVANGDYGKPVILRTVILVVLELVWAVVCLGMVIISCELTLYYDDEKMIFFTFMGILIAGMVLDVVLLQLGNFFFKPNEIQNA